MKQLIGVWEKPYYTFELGIGKSIRLLNDSKGLEFNELFNNFIKKHPGATDLNLFDPLINDLYFGMVYHEQALVLCVSSFEVYFKRKLDEIFEKLSEPKQESLTKRNFQNLDDCKDFADTLKLASFGEDEKRLLKEPFQDRHIITHNGSLIDNKWVTQLDKPEILAEMNQKQSLTYDYVKQTIVDCHKIVTHIETEINEKYDIEGSRGSLVNELIKNL